MGKNKNMSDNGDNDSSFIELNYIKQKILDCSTKKISIRQYSIAISVIPLSIAADILQRNIQINGDMLRERRFNLSNRFCNVDMMKVITKKRRRRTVFLLLIAYCCPDLWFWPLTPRTLILLVANIIILTRTIMVNMMKRWRHRCT